MPICVLLGLLLGLFNPAVVAGLMCVSWALAPGLFLCAAASCASVPYCELDNLVADLLLGRVSSLLFCLLPFVIVSWVV